MATPRSAQIETPFAGVHSLATGGLKVKIECARLDSNQRPLPCEGSALSRLSYGRTTRISILNRNPETFILVPKAGWGLVEWYEPSVIAKMRAGKAAGNEGEEEEVAKSS